MNTGKKTLHDFWQTYGILAILLLGFVLRMMVLTRWAEMPIVRDEIAYSQLAYKLLKGLPQYTEIFRPPLYPAFLALCFRLFGDTRFIVGIAQSLLDTANIALLFAITQRLFHKPRLSILAALFYAIYPEAIELTRSFFSEILFLFLSGCGFYLLLGFRQTKSLFTLLLAGICLGIAALTRELLGYFILFIVPLWFWLVTSPQYKLAIMRSVFFLAGVLIILTPWTIRNWQIENRFILISTSGEYNIVNDNARIVRRIINRTPLANRQVDPSQFPRSLREVTTALQRQAPSNRSRYAIQVALRSIAFDPLTWLITKSASVGFFASGNTILTPFTRTPGWVLESYIRPISSFYVVVLLLFATIGLFFAPGNASKLLILLYFFYSISIFVLTHFLIRFRAPLVPLLIPFAAFAILEWRDWLRPSRRLFVSLGTVAIFLWLAIVQSV